MIYFDNAATTLSKPPAVADAVARAIGTLGNPGRSFHEPAVAAAREVYAAREAVARLVGLDDPLRVAFTSGATESLNLAASALFEDGGEAVVTVYDHNSALRPVYRRSGAAAVLGCGGDGELLYDNLRGLITPCVRAVFAAHGSNVTGGVVDAARIYAVCRERGVPFVLDAAQTLGSVSVRADMADIICFTGHKGLFGPQGTGGLIMAGDLPRPIKPPKTGGSGYDSFGRLQPAEMPGMFEAGTMNSHGLAGLRAGADFVRDNIDSIQKKESGLLRAFLDGLRDVPDVTVYGGRCGVCLPVVSLNIGGYDSSRAAELLWEEFGIATRPGVHCAPLTHDYLGTADRGAVRFSFSFFNTVSEIDAGVRAVKTLAARKGWR